MLVTIDRRDEAPAICNHLRQSNHPACFACGGAVSAGLALDFQVEGPGCVEATFECPERLKSYDGVLHGGVICLLLDAAMTNCGFSMGRVMVTGDLNVRFLHPVPTGESVSVRAWADPTSDLLQVVRAEISLNGQVMARAVGRFVDRPPADSTPGL